MTIAVPHVECEQHHVRLWVGDVLAAADHYVSQLGFSRGFSWGDPPRMVGVNLGGVSLHLEQGTPSPAGCSVYFVVGDADALYEFQRASGADVVAAPEDRPYGMRDYRVRDRDGYELEFGHRVHHVGPPLEIERVDVPVRLEKRLAALLHDLAAFKRMSLSSCLEEALLHTFEPGEAAASPHGAKALEHIRKLKQKHGIDYDAHASYRFVER